VEETFRVPSTNQITKVESEGSSTPVPTSGPSLDVSPDGQLALQTLTPLAETEEGHRKGRCAGQAVEIIRLVRCKALNNGADTGGLLPLVFLIMRSIS